MQCALSRCKEGEDLKGWVTGPQMIGASWDAVFRSLDEAERLAVRKNTTKAVRTGRDMQPSPKKNVSPAVARSVPDIRYTPRCSTADRMRYADHMASMFAEGLLTQEEWELRHDACMAAVTLEELKRMLQDLPKLPPEQEIPQPGGSWQPPKPVMLTLAAGFFSAAGLAASIGNPGNPVQFICEGVLAGSISAVLGMLFSAELKAMKKRKG